MIDTKIHVLKYYIIIDLLRPSILDPFIIDEEIYNKESAEAYLVKLPTRAKNLSADKSDKEFSTIERNKTTKLSYLYAAFKEALFPHITSNGNLNKAKAFYLGYVTKKLLLLKLGIELNIYKRKMLQVNILIVPSKHMDAYFCSL